MKPSVDLNPKLKQLMDNFWFKVSERNRNNTQSFRLFDTNHKGKFNRADFIHGCANLRMRHTADELDRMWQYMDS